MRPMVRKTSPKKRKSLAPMGKSLLQIVFAPVASLLLLLALCTTLLSLCVLTALTIWLAVDENARVPGFLGILLNLLLAYGTSIFGVFSKNYSAPKMTPVYLSRAGSLHLRPFISQRALLWIVLPGLLSLLLWTFGVTEWDRISATRSFMISFMIGLVAFLPLSLTRRLTTLHRTIELHCYTEEIQYLVDNNWYVARVGDITSVTLERDTKIADEAYHEDDDTQHILTISHSDGQKFSVQLSAFAPEQRTRLFKWLVSNLSDRVLSAAVKALYTEVPLKRKSTRRVQLDGAEQVNFTNIWESEFNARISRTNYIPLEIGHVLQSGRYTVAGFLSSGGFCTAYACDTTQGERVVLKESSIPSGLQAEARQRVSEMFEREARLLQRCSHPHIARILDCFQENDREYLVLEMIDGIPLSTLVRKTKNVSEKQALRWGLQMAEFLEHLHDLTPPIVHRDFTPENLLLHRSGDIYLIDFGAANEFIGQATGTLIGKQSYIPPEQLQGKAIPSSDIYSLGCCIYFLLTGTDPLPLTELHPKTQGVQCSQELDSLIGECTKFDKEQRPANATEVHQRLLALIAQEQ